VSNPRFISVIVPTFNRPVLLGEAVESIRALEGTDFQFEILVCDNGQARETQSVADRYGTKYIPVPKARGRLETRALMLQRANLLPFSTMTMFG